MCSAAAAATVAAGESLASFLGSCLSCLPSLLAPLPLAFPPLLSHTLHTQCAARQCLAAVTNIRLQLFALSQEESGKQRGGGCTLRLSKQTPCALEMRLPVSQYYSYVMDIINRAAAAAAAR